MRRPIAQLFLLVCFATAAVALAVAAAVAEEPAPAQPVPAQPVPAQSEPAAPAPAAPAVPSPQAPPPETPAPPAAEQEAAAPGAPSFTDKLPDPDILRGYFPTWASAEIIGIAIWQLAAGFVCLLAGLVLKKISDYLFENRITPAFRRTHFKFDHLLSEAASRPAGWLLFLSGAAATAWVFGLPTEPTDVRGLVFAAFKILLAADVMWFLFRLVDVLAGYLARLTGRTDSKLDDQLVPLIRKALKLTIGAVLAVWVIQLLGYSVSSLLAGLGIGGLAVALAMQDTLANFFGSIFIFLDRPFCVGDVVKIDDVEGTVEQVGFRSTRIRTWPATLVCIPNKKVAESVIDNLSKRPKRRVVQTVGVTYETTADQMERAVASIAAILEADAGVDPEVRIVRFEDFGASSLDIKVVYFTKAVDYAGHMETRERVNLAIMRALADMGLAIAFPTRTVYFEGDIARGMLRRDDGGTR
jgi:MscS family membrane protein